MRHAMAAGLVALFLGGAASADPVEGTWRSQPGGDGATITVAVTTCGSAICGTIASLAGSDNQAIVGRQIIWDMQPAGGGRYRGGKIWAPDQDKVYNSKMTLQGDALKVEGCVLVICRGQTWSRVR